MKIQIRNFIVVILLPLAIACSSGGNKAPAVDSPQAPSGSDTMPVLHPGKFDSSGTIKTPPTNDNNVIVPDSNTQNK